MSHPSCVDRGRRQDYSKGFRLFFLDLCAKHPDVAIETMAEASAVPLGALKDWLRTPAFAVRLGGRVDIFTFTKTWEAVRGKKLTLERLGSLDDLAHEMKRRLDARGAL